MFGAWGQQAWTIWMCTSPKVASVYIWNEHERAGFGSTGFSDSPMISLRPMVYLRVPSLPHVLVGWMPIPHELQIIQSLVVSCPVLAKLGSWWSGKLWYVVVLDVVGWLHPLFLPRLVALWSLIMTSTFEVTLVIDISPYSIIFVANKLAKRWLRSCI